jgi:hypothetical protein
MSAPNPSLLAEIVAVAGDTSGYGAFLSAGERCHFCSEPIRLVGSSMTVDEATGEVVESFSTEHLPRGELMKPCGTRRATRCPSCAAIYKGDARALVLAGMNGGNGVSEAVASRPMCFATLTAPSFGVVHRESASDGPCHARGPGRCQHGRLRSCLARHRGDDPVVGEAICSGCYDYEGAALLNASLSDLFRRTSIYTRRTLARVSGQTVREFDASARLSYVKVAEMQRRGVVHLHVVCRLDGANGDDPPDSLSGELLALALRLAVTQVRVPLPDNRGTARWGDQFDCQVLDGHAPEETRRIANYVAKYATKGSDDAGALDRRVVGMGDLRLRTLPPQLRRMAETAWQLGGVEALAPLRLRAWTHTLGLRSHFLTKSRHFSATFGLLRDKRQAWQRAAHSGVSASADTTLTVIGDWKFVRRGWNSSAEAYLARSEARRRAECRCLAYEDRVLGRGAGV